MAVRLATCGLCSRRRKLPHVCFLAVSAGVLKVRLDTKAPKKLSYIYINMRNYLSDLYKLAALTYLRVGLSWMWDRNKDAALTYCTGQVFRSKSAHRLHY